MGAFYTYELIDPRDGTVFYIGKGNGSRRYAHEKEARTLLAKQGEKSAKATKTVKASKA